MIPAIAWSILLWGATAPSPDLDDVRVTTTLRATNAVRAVQVLAEQTHAKLSAGPEMKADVVVIDVENVPLRTVMGKLAEACSAKWEQNEDAWILSRPPEMERAQKESERNGALLERRRIAAAVSKCVAAQKPIAGEISVTPARAAQVLDAICEMPTTLARLSPGPAFDEETKRLDRLIGELPTKRLVRRMWSLLPPESLAQIGEGLAVFALAPNRLQKPLPSSAQIALGRFVREQAIYAEAARARGEPAADAVGLGVVDDLFASGPLGMRLFVTVDGATSGELNMTLCALNRLGEVAVEWTDTLSVPELSPSAHPLPNLGRETVRFSEQARAMRSALREGCDVEPRPLLGQTLQIALDADKNDPLGTSATDVLLALGKAQSASLVACVPDAMFESERVAGEKLSDYAALFGQCFGSACEAKDGWLTLRPTRPCATRDSRADRGVLSKFAQRLAQPVPLTVEEAADWATMIPVDRSGIAPPYSLAVAHPRARREFLFGQLDALRAYGLLSRLQRDWVVAGRILDGRQLSRQSADYIDWLATRRRSLSVISSGLDEHEEWQADRLARVVPTEAVRGGVSPDTLLFMETSRQTVARKDGDSTFAKTVVVVEPSEVAADPEGAGKYAIRTTWTLRVAFNERYVLEIPIRYQDPFTEEFARGGGGPLVLMGRSGAGECGVPNSCYLQ